MQYIRSTHKAHAMQYATFIDSKTGVFVSREYTSALHLALKAAALHFVVTAEKLFN